MGVDRYDGWSNATGFLGADYDKNKVFVGYSFDEKLFHSNYIML